MINGSLESEKLVLAGPYQVLDIFLIFYVVFACFSFPLALLDFYNGSGYRSTVHGTVRIKC